MRIMMRMIPMIKTNNDKYPWLTGYTNILGVVYNIGNGSVP